MCELLLEQLTAIGLESKQFGLHSVRAGGATAAANAGVPDRLFKRHGHWRSENAKDGYVNDCSASRLCQLPRTLVYDLKCLSLLSVDAFCGWSQNEGKVSSTWSCVHLYFPQLSLNSRTVAHQMW